MKRILISDEDKFKVNLQEKFVPTTKDDEGLYWEAVRTVVRLVWENAEAHDQETEESERKIDQKPIEKK
jgi:hypothetical protein